MRVNRIPVVKALLVFSWLIAILGSLGGGSLIIFKFKEINLLISGCGLLLGSLFLAALIRMFANIGQMFFDLKAFLFRDLQSLSEGFIILSRDIRETTASLSQDIYNQKAILEQMNCDSKDINQNIQRITTFFEQIERQLDLKK